MRSANRHFDQLMIEFREKSDVVALGKSDLHGPSAFLGE